jgi:hypothetical protein
MLSMIETPDDPYTHGIAQYFLRRWNATHVEAERFVSVKIDLLALKTPDPGERACAEVERLCVYPPCLVTEH